jgi:16S rRNA (uracil1498-N3)-methyltransferase
VKQFILESEPDSDGIVRLEGNDYRYLVRVRRLAAGENFPALLPNGKETLVQILSINKNVLTGKCIAPENLKLNLDEETSLPPIILFQALPKNDKMDLIVRQAAESGIARIVPFFSEFSNVKKSTKTQGQKFSRWERIIKEARQQSGSKIATSICPPLTINELIEYWKNRQDDPAAGKGIGLLFHHQGLAQESLHSYLNNIPGIVALAVGPEGGFSDKEVSLFIENGFMPFTIGDTVLRTETAALYCAAVIKIILLERDSWVLKQVKTNRV